MQLKQIMTREVETIQPSATLQQAAEKIAVIAQADESAIKINKAQPVAACLTQRNRCFECDFRRGNRDAVFRIVRDHAIRFNTQKRNIIAVNLRAHSFA